MSKKSWLIICSPDRLRVGSVEASGALEDIVFPAEQSAEALGELFTQKLREIGYREQSTIVAVDSHMCLAATMPHSGKRSARNHQSMSFALEEFLPLPAEEATCDFVVFNNDALGVAIEVNTVKPILDALEKAAVKISSITPLAVLTLQQLAPAENRRHKHIIAWEDNRQFEWFLLKEGQPALWKTFPATEDALTREIKMLHVGQPPADVDGITLVNPNDSIMFAAKEVAEEIPVTTRTENIQKITLTAASDILQGKKTQWIELCRDQLGEYDPYRALKSRFHLFAVAVICLFICMAAATWIRADRYADLANEYKKQQEVAFHDVFPEKRAPGRISVRLESELKKISGLTGATGAMPQLSSATLLLREVIAPLPQDMRYRIIEVDLSGDQVSINAEVRHYGDDDKLVRALRDAGFEVEPPSTEQIGSKGFSTVINATRISPEKTPKGKKAK